MRRACGPGKPRPMRVMDYDYIWFWRSRLPERKGQRCRVLVRGKRNTVLVEFEDGVRFVTSRHAVRRSARRDDPVKLPAGDP
jgi:hypothetical protein